VWSWGVHNNSCYFFLNFIPCVVVMVYITERMLPFLKSTVFCKRNMLKQFHKLWDLTAQWQINAHFPSRNYTFGDFQQTQNTTAFFTVKVRWSGLGLKLTTHLHLVLRLRMRGAIPTLSHMSSWRGIYVNTTTTLTLPLLFLLYHRLLP